MSDYAAHADAALMRLVQRGDLDAFAQLVARYERPLRRVATSRMGRVDWAEDIVQETFMAAYKSAASYDPQKNFRTWLWTILLNNCRGHARRRGRTPSVSCWADAGPDESTARDSDNVPCGEPMPLARLLEKERRALLESLLRRLSPAQADAIRLRFFGGLKYHEIAAAMQCSLSTAKNRVRWGLLRMSDLTQPSGTAQSGTAPSGTAREASHFDQHDEGAEQ